MDAEVQSARGLLAPTAEQLASVKVFPLILSLRKEITVSEYHLPPSSPYLFSSQNTIGMCQPDAHLSYNL